MNKINIGITQRIIRISKTKEIRDSLDQNWTSFVNNLDCNLILIPTLTENPREFLKYFKISGLILSGGGNISSSWKTIHNDSPNMPFIMKDVYENRDILESKLLFECIELKIPVIGVCRGMQFINLFHGGKVQSIDSHVNVNHKIFSKNKSKFLFDEQVNSFHDYGISIDDLGDGLQILCQSDEKYIEAFFHPKYNHLGIMWHPERNHPFSKKDLKFFKSFFNGKVGNFSDFV